MPSACLCYVVDERYLFPTLISAMQGRQQISPDLAEVVIVCICAGSSADTHAVCEVAERSHIRVLQIGADAIEGMHPMWGRMFLHRILPAHFRRVLYLDGDTQIAASLDPLFQFDLPRERMLVTRDPMLSFVRLGWPWRQQHERHCAKIGFTLPPERYFNSGLLMFHRDDWEEVAARCFVLYREKGDSFLYPDQDALNLAVPDRALLLSERWNFPGFLIGSPVERVRQPYIYHFFSNPRPWLVAAPPWGEAAARPYRQLLEAEPALQKVAPSYSRGKRLRYQLQQRFKMLVEYRRVGRLTDELPVDLDL